MKLNDVKIGARIAALAGSLMVATLVTGVVALYELQSNESQFEHSQVQAHEFEHAADTARQAQLTFKVQIQEWKNILLRGGQPDAFDKYRQAFAKEAANTQAKLAELKASFDKLQLPANDIVEAQTALATLTTKYQEALAGFDPAKPDASAHEIDAKVKGLDRPPTQKIDAIVAQVLEAANLNRASTMEAARQGVRATKLSLAVILLVTVAVGAAVSWLILRSITQPLQRAVSMAQDVAAGKLSQRVHGEGRDEVSALMTAMGLMSESLHRVVSQVRQSSQMVAHASAEIESGNADLSMRTEEQASNLQQTASSVEQLSGDVKLSADHAVHARDLANTASDAAERGGNVVGQVVQTMHDINASSRKISEIIGVIDGIAFQTNILALNAAVEAARAGEQGRGFAVVASEVRALAQRSATAAKEIKTLINVSVEYVDRGSNLVTEAGSSISATMGAVKQVRDMIAEITTAASQQAASIVEVSQAIGAVDNTMQQNAALVEEAAAAASSLKQQADALQDCVAFFET